LLDINVTNPGTSAVSRTLTIPTGFKLEAILNVMLIAQVGVDQDISCYLSSFDQTDSAASVSAAPLGQLSSIAEADTAYILSRGLAQVRIGTSTAAAIRSRLSVSNTNVGLAIATCGWVDTRGRLG
jgi:hypothetical protein